MRDHPVDLAGIADVSYEKQIINEKYDYIEEIIKECLFNKEERSAWTDCGPVSDASGSGIPILLGIMALVFFPTFYSGRFRKGYRAGAGTVLREDAGCAETMDVAPWLISWIVDGMLWRAWEESSSFLPNIFILFLALAFLEDSGYMSRVAYVMNETMGMVGLSGKAFLPMLLGFGCTVPAIMATRARWRAGRTG